MQEGRPADHRVTRPTAPARVAVAVVAIVSFAGGFCASALLNERRVREQSAQRFRECLSIGMDMGFVTVDRRKLDEIVCIVSESEWDDVAALAPGAVVPQGSIQPERPAVGTGPERAIDALPIPGRDSQ